MPAPDAMIGSLASVPLDVLRDASDEAVDAFQKMLFRKHRIEVPVFRLAGELPCVRISAHAYNGIGQYERLAGVLREEL